MHGPVEANWYDFPEYYDVAFSEETIPEANFVEAAARKFMTHRAIKLLEPGCGTGRLVVELARRGYEVTGFDLCRPGLEFCKKRLAKENLDADLFEGDMASFDVGKQTFDVAFNFCNTFRHLTSETAARSHLASIAASLKPGGLYLLGFHLMPPDADEEDEESWTETAGDAVVTTTFTVLSTDWERRIEILRTELLARNSKSVLAHVRTDYPMRLYARAHFLSLLELVPELALRGVYDFWYDLGEPRKLDDEISDAVFVLQRI